MKTVFVFALVIVAALAAPADKDATIVKDEQEVRVDGYKFAFETSDGNKRDEEAELKQVGTETSIVVKGSYSYVAPDGQVISVNYIADENGFQPDNLPKA